MGHTHQHHHQNHINEHHKPIDFATTGARFIITILLNVFISTVQIVGGLISGSLSLLSDALHNMNDAVAILVSYIAIRIGRQPKTVRFTFGLKRAEILAAIFNSSVLIVLCFFLIKEAYLRFRHPEPIAGGLMIVVAIIGLIANLISAVLLKTGAHKNINIRSAYLHLLGDTVSSAAVVIGGLFIYFYHIYWIDPLLTVLISIYILKESIEIVKEAVNVLMMGAPETVSIESLRKEIEDLPQVRNIHHVHIWKLDDQVIHFEAHIGVEDMPVSRTEALSFMISEKLKQNHGIHHITLQFETSKNGCDKC